jgi:hypothetical protein
MGETNLGHLARWCYWWRYCSFIVICTIDLGAGMASVRTPAMGHISTRWHWHCNAATVARPTFHPPKSQCHVQLLTNTRPPHSKPHGRNKSSTRSFRYFSSSSSGDELFVPRRPHGKRKNHISVPNRKALFQPVVPSTTPSSPLTTAKLMPLLCRCNRCIVIAKEYILGVSNALANDSNYSNSYTATNITLYAIFAFQTLSCTLVAYIGITTLF